MTDTLDDVLAALRGMGYDSVTPNEGYDDEAGGVVPLPAEHRAEPRTGWRRFLPRLSTAATLTWFRTTFGRRWRSVAGPSSRWGGTRRR